MDARGQFPVGETGADQPSPSNAKVQGAWRVTSILVCTCTVCCLWVHAWPEPSVSRRLRLLAFADNRHIPVARLLDVRSGRLYPQGISLSRPQSHSAAGRIMSMKNVFLLCIYIYGNRGSTVVKVLCYKSEGR